MKFFDVLKFFFPPNLLTYLSLRGYAVAQLFETLRYKPEGRGLGSCWCDWKFSFA